MGKVASLEMLAMDLTAQPPPQLSQDGHWRWDGQRWVPIQPPLRGPVPAQRSADGHWWWNGRRWVPAEAVFRPRHRTAGTLANAALLSGLLPFGAAVILAFGTQAGVEGSSKFSPATMIVTLAACAAPGLILGVLALVRPAHGHNLRRRWTVAGIGIVLALLGSIALFSLMQAINSWIGP